MPLVIKLPTLPISAALRRRTAETFRRASNLVPTTWMGSLVGVLSVMSLWRWGYGQMDLLVFVFSLSGLALLGLGALFTVGSSLYLRRHLERHPELLQTPLPAIETGSPTETSFALPSLGWLPLVKVQWRFISPGGMHCRPRWRQDLLVEEVIAGRRCHVSEAVREVETRDAFGLSRLAWRCEHAGPLMILPDVGRLKAMPRLQSMSSAEGLPHPSGAPEGDRMEIRRYVPGDPVRHILWKVYARTRQLNVRVPERAVDRSQRIVAYLLTSPGDGAAAAAARVALQNGLLGPDWLFAADGFPEPTDDLQEGLLAIAGSGQSEVGASKTAIGETDGDTDGATNSRSDKSDGLRAFLAHPKIAKESHCVIFAAADPGPWVADTMASTRSFSGTISFILGTDGVSDEASRPWWQRLLFNAEPLDTDRGGGVTWSPGAMSASSTTVTELSSLMASLHAGRHPVMVVDRKSGRTHGRIDSQSIAAAGAFAAASPSPRELGRTG